MKTFDGVFENVEINIRDAAHKLREIVIQEIPEVEEAVIGGAKVQNVLYYSGDSSRVVCGIQPAGERCLFYLHRVTQEDVPEYHLGGKGKHAKHIEFRNPEEIMNAVISHVIAVSVERL